MKSILNPSFKYVPSSVHADGSDYLRAKFKRLMKEHRDRDQANQAEAARVVTALPKKGK